MRVVEMAPVRNYFGNFDVRVTMVNYSYMCILELSQNVSSEIAQRYTDVRLYPYISHSAAFHS